MFCILGLQFAVDSIKSFVVPIAVVDKHISIENAMYLSRLETEVQVMCPCSLHGSGSSLNSYNTYNLVFFVIDSEMGQCRVVP